MDDDSDPISYWNQRLAKNFPMAPSDAIEREFARLADAGLVGAEAAKRVKEKDDAENARVADAVRAAAAEALANTPATARKRPVLLDIALGEGHLAAALIPLAIRQGWHYIGVDPSDEAHKKTNQRLASSDITSGFVLVKAAAGKHLLLNPELFEPNSSALVVWGRLGLHLPEDEQFRIALHEVSTLTAESGYFLLCETLQDYNPQFRQNPVKHKQTRIRALSEYEASLPLFRLIRRRPVEFWGEQLGVVLWQKHAGGAAGSVG